MGWTATKAVKEVTDDIVTINGKTYKSALAAWEEIGITSFTTYQGRKANGYALEVCLGLLPIPKQQKYEINGRSYATLEEVAKSFNLTVAQINSRLQTMSLEEAIIYTPQNNGQYNMARFDGDPKLAKTIGIFYFVKIEVNNGILHKIGITLHSLEKRFKTQNIKVIIQFKGEMKKLYILEQRILKEFRDNHYRADEEFDGRTETFLFLENEEKEVVKLIKNEMTKIENN
ncbi:MAG TPA: hypothetical protein DIW23_06285 [Anaerolineae bacterium]|nr:hypothetical protein [Anaerolineae bacterium]